MEKTDEGREDDSFGLGHKTLSSQKLPEATFQAFANLTLESLFSNSKDFSFSGWIERNCESLPLGIIREGGMGVGNRKGYGDFALGKQEKGKQSWLPISSKSDRTMVSNNAQQLLIHSVDGVTIFFYCTALWI